METIKIFLVTVLFLFLIMGPVKADLLPLVQCGLTVDDPCEFCDFFDMLSRIIQLIMIRFVPLIATLLLVVGGSMLLFAGADPHLLQTAKNIIKSTLIGVVVIFAAFMIVGIILNAIGLNVWTQNLYKNWLNDGFFQIPGC